MDLFGVDWKGLFVPTLPVAEIIVRGSIIYLTLFLFLRFLRRQAGALGIADVLLIVLIADAAQNALGADYKSVTEGIILVATIGFWDFSLDWLGYHIAWFRPLTRPPALPLVKNGRVLRRNLRREMITEEELLSQLRQQGVDDLTKVKEAYLEGDGHVSAIPLDEPKSGGSGAKDKAVR